MEFDNWLWEQILWVNKFDGFFANLLEIFVPVFLGVWLSVKTTLKNFIHEKWWEQKSNAYESVISAVYRSFSFYDEAVHALSNGGMNGEGENGLRVQMSKADKLIAEMMTIGAFKISQATLDRLKKFHEEEYLAKKTTDWSEHIIKSYAIHKKCLDDLILLAKDDLQLKN